jgi:mono/diheme cytochrome c family protein
MKLLIIGCVLTIAMWTAPARAGAAEGKEVYMKSCKSCHGAEGQGNPAIAKVMKVVMKALGSKEVQAKSDDELKAAVTKGTGKMKAVAGLSAKQIDDVVAFVRTLK